MEWNGLYGILSNDMEHAEYDDVYDENGGAVYCECGAEICWRDGVYICPQCGKTMSRQTFFDYIGAKPLGEACLRCDNLYPGCMSCPYGYLNDTNR